MRTVGDFITVGRLYHAGAGNRPSQSPNLQLQSKSTTAAFAPAALRPLLARRIAAPGTATAHSESDARDGLIRKHFVRLGKHFPYSIPLIFQQEKHKIFHPYKQPVTDTSSCVFLGT